MQIDIVNFYRNNLEVLEKIQDEDNKESVYQYYEQQLQEVKDLFQDQGLTLFPDNLEFEKYEGDLSSVGGSFSSITLTSPENDFQLEFEIYKSTGHTNLWVRRFKAIKMKRADSIEFHEFLKKEKVSFLEQNVHFDALLLEESESISAEDFAEKATPLIKQILTLHHIQF